MKRHAPKVSRKKLKEQIKKLEGTILALYMVNISMAAVYAAHINIIHASTILKAPLGPGIIVHQNIKE